MVCEVGRSAINSLGGLVCVFAVYYTIQSSFLNKIGSSKALSGGSFLMLIGNISAVELQTPSFVRCPTSLEPDSSPFVHR